MEGEVYILVVHKRMKRANAASTTSHNSGSLCSIVLERLLVSVGLFCTSFLVSKMLPCPRRLVLDIAFGKNNEIRE